MIVPLLAGLVPVAIGAAFAWVAGREHAALGPARALALGATLSLVLGHLLPEAWGLLGPVALLWFFAGLGIPAVLERSVRRLGHGVAVDMVLFGLAAHQIGDGVQLAAAGRMGATGLGLMAALGLHSMPMVAVACLGHGAVTARSVSLRGGLLAGTTALGVVLGWLGTGLAGDLVDWLPALLSGLLLHALWHEVGDHRPSTGRARLAEAGAFLLGVVLPIVAL